MEIIWKLDNYIVGDYFEEGGYIEHLDYSPPPPPQPLKHFNICNKRAN